MDRGADAVLRGAARRTGAHTRDRSRIADSTAISARRSLTGSRRSLFAPPDCSASMRSPQICVVATYWCVFALGRAIVGATHAAMAVLLMVGIFVFTVPTPNFGPPILAMALWAAALLFYWRAVAQAPHPILVCARWRGCTFAHHHRGRSYPVGRLDPVHGGNRARACGGRHLGGVDRGGCRCRPWCFGILVCLNARGFSRWGR